MFFFNTQKRVSLFLTISSSRTRLACHDLALTISDKCRPPSSNNPQRILMIEEVDH